MDVTIRDARRDDAGGALLYSSSPRSYDAYFGGEAAARRSVDWLYRRRGHVGSFEICRVAELDGTVAGIASSYPEAARGRLSRRGYAVELARIHPWRWPRALLSGRATARTDAPVPPNSLYVDALAVDPAHRRRGVATALLADAERRARDAGLSAVALDTELDNAAAQALYEAAGFVRGPARHASAADARLIGYAGAVPFVKTL